MTVRDIMRQHTTLLTWLGSVLTLGAGDPPPRDELQRPLLRAPRTRRVLDPARREEHRRAHRGPLPPARCRLPARGRDALVTRDAHALEERLRSGGRRRIADAARQPAHVARRGARAARYRRPV